MYCLKDISVIIPTYNRENDLKITLQSFKKNISNLKEVIIVDQSESGKTKDLIKSLGHKNIKYLHSKIPSITLSRNLGIKKSSEKAKIICFLDDDVNIGKDYFEKIVEVFNEFNCVGVAGYVPVGEYDKFTNFIKKIFFLGHLEKDNARIISAYGNTYPSKITKIINSEWLPGVNMNYKRQIFEEFEFDENLMGYTIAEDIDFSYRISKKFAKSIFITPHAKIIHRVSKIQRTPTRKMSYINQVDHFYFHFKNIDKNLKNDFIFIWSLFGISLLRTLNYLFTLKKDNFLKLKYYFLSMTYCLNNLSKIKKGLVREWK